MHPAVFVTVAVAVAIAIAIAVVVTVVKAIVFGCASVATVFVGLRRCYPRATPPR